MEVTGLDWGRGGWVRGLYPRTPSHSSCLVYETAEENLDVPRGNTVEQEQAKSMSGAMMYIDWKKERQLLKSPLVTNQLYRPLALTPRRGCIV